MAPQPCTLVLPIKDNTVILGMKKRGFGAGKWNGFGGKLHEGESLADAACRELEEESSIVTTPEKLVKVGDITFLFPEKPDWDQIVHVYLLHDFEDTSKESEEMLPKAFALDGLPYADMWSADGIWIPVVLKGKMTKATVTFKGTGGDWERIEFFEPEAKVITS